MPAQLLLALPDSGDAEPVARLRKRWREADIEVELLHFHNDSTDEAIESEFVRALAGRKIVIGGFSRGARIAAGIAESSDAQASHARALLCLAYPFHKHGHSETRHGLQNLLGLTLPTLIVQGSRDAHGNREEVRGYAGIPACVRLHWIEDGNHRWQARAKSKLDQEELLRRAAQSTVDFVRAS